MQVSVCPVIFYFCYFVGYVVADESHGETPLVPSELVDYSMQETPHIDIDTTLRLLVSPDVETSAIPGHNKTDKLVR